jgi:hypothetical protein
MRDLSIHRTDPANGPVIDKDAKWLSCSEKAFQSDYAALYSMSGALTGKSNLRLLPRSQGLPTITAPQKRGYERSRTL